MAIPDAAHHLLKWGVPACASWMPWLSVRRMSASQRPSSACLSGRSSSSWRLALRSMSSSGSSWKGRTCAAALERSMVHSRAQRLWYTSAVLPVKLGVAAVEGRWPSAGVLNGLQPASPT